MKKTLRRAALVFVCIVLALMMYSCGGGENTCEHTATRTAKENEQPATCTEQGVYEEVIYCTECSMDLGRDKKFTDALGHDEQSHSGKAPGCLEAGYGDYVTCSRCEYTTYSEMAATGHNPVHHPAKNETCTEIGWYDYETCTNCDYTTYVEIPACSHDIVTMLSSEPTCTNAGWNDYEYCSRCDYSTYEEIPALDHKKISCGAQEPTCTDFGWNEYEECERCDWDSKQDNLIDPLDHDKVYHDPQSETCTEDGWYAYESCSRCSWSTKQDNIIEKRHIIATDYGRPASCTEIGWEIYDYCIRCEYKNGYVEIPAFKHDIITVPAKTPTCTKGGWNEYHYCSRGDYSTEVENLLPALDHKIINHPAKEPTCYEDGWYAYQTCERCDDINTFEARECPGHSYVITNVSPTCTEPGSKTTTCGRCTDVNEYEVLGAYGHEWKTVERVDPTCTTVGYEEVTYCKRCLNAEGKLGPDIPMIKTLDHTFVGGECTVCHNREGSVGLEFLEKGRSYEVVGIGTCADKVLVIPSTYNGLPISSIGQLAFRNADIVSIFIPSTLDPGIISIDASVFMDCHNLVEIINNSEIETKYFNFFIESQILCDHKGESKLVLSGEYYFYVENGEAILVSYIGGAAEITLPADFNGNNYKIHANAFRESGITSITIPTAVTEIGEGALYTATNTKCVTVKYLGTIDEWKQITKSADTNQWINEIVYHYGRECDSVLVPAKAPTCTEAGYNEHLTECTLCKKSVTEKIEEAATGHFYEYAHCQFCGDSWEASYGHSEGLEFTLSEDGTYYILTGMGECTDEYILIQPYYNDKPVAEIGESAFEGTEIFGVNVPVTVKSIGYKAFFNCYNLKYVSLGYGVKTIGVYAFGFCDKLVYITIGGDLKKVESNAFAYCESLTDVYYLKSEEDFEKIEISEYDNECFTEATIHYDWKLYGENAE